MATILSRRTKVIEKKHKEELKKESLHSDIKYSYLTPEELEYYRNLPPPKKNIGITAPQRMPNNKYARTGGER